MAQAVLAHTSAERTGAGHSRAGTAEPEESGPARSAHPGEAGSLASPLLSLRPTRPRREEAAAARGAGRGFGPGVAAGRAPRGEERNRGSGGRGRKRRGTGFSAADRLPLGRSPDLEAIEARQRLALPLAGRLRGEEVNRAWKRAAAEHHPDRGGELERMQSLNAARDLLLGRGES